MYKFFIRRIFFLMDPEYVHHLVIRLLKCFCKIPLYPWLIRTFYDVRHPSLVRRLWGLEFPNPVGLAAGFDKDAKAYQVLSYFGFGFIEIGTLTPKPQPGNPPKRMFRLIKDKGIINRMGFNNEGVLAAVERLKKNKNVLIGGNIGKNKLTPNDRALEDYLFCLENLYPYVDYFVVNVSSPNTPGLRDLQEKEPLTNLMKTLKKRGEQLHKKANYKNPKPILLKIAPDLTDGQLLDIIEIVQTTKTDGVIATNTTINKTGLKSEHQNEMGGLSGKPLTDRSTEVIRFLAEKSNKSFPIIGVGGIHSAEDALNKLAAGADLIQLYTGFIYEGPGLIKKINKALMQNQV